MRIALMGATGSIGQCLLRDHGDRHQFVVFTPKSHLGGFYRNENIEYVTVSARTIEDAGGRNPYAEPGLLERCSAAVALGFARPEPGSVDTFERYLPSIASTSAFLDACRTAGIGNIVLASSRSVYGKHMPLPHREDEAACPFSFYGAAKLAAEGVALASNSMWGAHVKVLRFAQIIGADERQGVVAANLAAAQRGVPLQLWGQGDETAREYLYVRDAASAILRALECRDVDGVFNIGTGIMTSTSDLLECIAGVYEDVGVGIERHPEKQVEKVACCMDVSKARNVLGWKAEWALDEAIRAIRADLSAR